MTTNKVKLFIIFIEHRLMKRPRIFHFQRKFVILQLILTIFPFLLQVYLSRSFTVNTLSGERADKLTFIDVLYFTVITATTVGFGDFNLDYEYYLRTIKSANEQTVIVQTIKQVFYTINFYFVMAMSASLINTMVNLEINPRRANNKVKITEKLSND